MIDVAPAFNNTVLVVTVDVFNASLKVAVTVVEVAMLVALVSGLVEVTVGAVRSAAVVKLHT